MHTDSSFFFRIKELYARLAAPPAFQDRGQTDAAGRLHAVLLTIIFLFTFALLIGLPFLFSNQSLGAAVCFVMLGSSTLCWNLMQRGLVRQSGLILIAILWLTVVFVILFAQRGDIIPFVSVMFVAYLLSGPRLALAVAGSAILLIATVLFAEPLGIPMPAVLFHPAPSAVLVFTVMALILATLPFALLNRRLRQAVQRLERFRAVQQNLRIITWIWDISHDQIQWDGDLSPLLGLSPGAFSGRLDDALRLIHPEDAPITKRKLIDCLNGLQTSYRSEARIIWPDGSLHWLATEGQATIGANGRATSMTGIVTDVTERKIGQLALTSANERFMRTDAQLRELNLSLEQRVRDRTAELELANRGLESFSYSISHDLRAPLRAINGFAQVLSTEYKARLDEQGSSLLSRIMQNAARMSRLIDDVLEFARAGRGTLNPETIDMRALVDEVIADLQASTGSNAQIVIGELPQATGDAVIVRQIWQNLIGNAHKFSRNAARPKIEIEGAACGAMIEYLVRDNGAGFDAAYADKLFGVFQRLHTASEFEGTGIGLAIVRRIVQRHGGSISAEGAVGKGATFRFTMPADANP